MSHELPALDYDYAALEPHLDTATMKLHHQMHHAAYVKGLNTAELKLAEARERGDFSLVKHWEREIAFHGAGHFLHSLYWKNLSPNGGGKPSGVLLSQIERDFSSYDIFVQQFKAAAIAVEGSGWGIVAKNYLTAKLEILTAEKHQDLTQWFVQPILVLDVWEHAYYLKFQNRRAEFVDAYFNVINWKDVEKRFAESR